MDLIPTDMIQMIEVNKTVTPDMEGDAIGGSVNLVTRSNPNAFKIQPRKVSLLVLVGFGEIIMLMAMLIQCHLT